MRLIDADALKIDIEENSIVMEGVQSIEVECAKSLIDIAPTECEKYRSFCMAKQRPQGETNAEIFKQTFGIYATEVWSMKEADFLKWLNAEQD